MNKEICFFGSYDSKYPRNLLTRKALKKLGWKIIECNDFLPGMSHYLRLISKFIKNGRKSNLIFVGFLGHYDIPLAWLLAKIFRRELIFDAFFSLFDTYIEDRKKAPKFSILAFRSLFYDWISTRLADKVILDTKENINYFINKYKAERNKFFELPVTADPDIFIFNPPKKHKIFSVGFYGSFMPLHGVEIIIQAAYFLKKEKIKFYLLGDGPGLKKIIRITKKLSLGGKVKIDSGQIPYKELPNFLTKIDLFLAGPFGNSSKAKRIITAKTAEALSVGIPTIVTTNNSTKRLLGNYLGNIVWIKQNDAEELAYAIKVLYHSRMRAKNINYFLKSELSFSKFQNKLKKILN